MAINDKIKVTRSQLAKFISDPDTIKQFEKVFDLVNSLELTGEETLEETITRIHNSLP